MPSFGSLSPEYNSKVFQEYYNKVSKYNFSNANFTLKQDSSGYFDLNNVMLDGGPKKIKLFYFHINQTDNWLDKDIYCMEYGSNF